MPPRRQTFFRWFICKIRRRDGGSPRVNPDEVRISLVRYTFLLIVVFIIVVMAIGLFLVRWIFATKRKGKLREQFHFVQPGPVVIFRFATMFGNAAVVLLGLAMCHFRAAASAAHDSFTRC